MYYFHNYYYNKTIPNKFLMQPYGIIMNYIFYEL